jgi:hypothetical protein
MAIDAAVLEGQFWYRPKSEPKLIIHVSGIRFYSSAARVWSTAFSHIFSIIIETSIVIQKDSSSPPRSP